MADRQAQRQNQHTPYSVDRTLRLRRLEHQLHVLADAIRVLADNRDDPIDRTVAGVIQKMLDDCEA